MRVDMVERLLALIRIAARDGSFKITEEMLSIAGASKEQMSKVLMDLDFELLDQDKNQEITFDTVFKKKKKFIFKNKTKTIKKIKKDKILKKMKTSKNTTTNIKINPDSPFAVLSNLKLNK